MSAYEQALSATSKKWAPWYVIPADHKWVTRALVAGILTSTICGLHLHYPKLSEEQRRALAAAKRRLLRE